MVCNDIIYIIYYSICDFTNNSILILQYMANAKKKKKQQDKRIKMREEKKNTNRQSKGEQYESLFGRHTKKKKFKIINLQ